MKILKLTIKKHWFDLIASGKKPDEYRGYKPFWISRLEDIYGCQRIYDEIHLFNGGYYGYNLPHIKIKYKGWVCAKYRPPQNGEPDVQLEDFAIDVSEILEIKGAENN